MRACVCDAPCVACASLRCALCSHRADHKVNNAQCQVLRNREWVTLRYCDIVVRYACRVRCALRERRAQLVRRPTHSQVGDIVKVTEDMECPADIVLVASSGEGGMCYIETANLDGETNLKIRTAVLVRPSCRRVCHHHTDDEPMHSRTRAMPMSLTCCPQSKSCNIKELSGVINAEKPNNRLYKFEGTLSPRWLERFDEASTSDIMISNDNVRAQLLHCSTAVYLRSGDSSAGRDVSLSMRVLAGRASRHCGAPHH